jgi:hypothetical protein
MAAQGESGTKHTLRKLGLSSLVAAVGAGIGLLFTVKPKRLRETVANLPGEARDLVGDLTQRARPDDAGDGAGQPMPQEISDEFEARRSERRERREQRRQHATG